jgi:hypothetical protein
MGKRRNSTRSVRASAGFSHRPRQTAFYDVATERVARRVMLLMNKRTLTEKEKQDLLAIHRKDGIVRCFVDNAPIEDDKEIEFHHIRPWSENGPTLLENMAPVCKQHHRRIGTLSLQEFRDKLRLDEFFGARNRKLDDILEARLGRGGFGQRTIVEVSAKKDNVVVYWEDRQRQFPLYNCPATGFPYFHALVPLAYIKNDTEIQPRDLESNRVWELYRHFLQYTQLAPSICRIETGQILLFDGQHKAAAQIWCGRTEIECKIYVDPEVRAVKEAVLMAHDKLRQMPFYSSTLIMRYADLYHEDWEGYMGRPGPKSEAGFVDYLRNARGFAKAQALARIRAAIQEDVLDDPENTITEFVEERNRTRKNPLTLSGLQRTFFAEFIAPPPLTAEFEGPDDFRVAEKHNLVRLLHVISEHTLKGKWNPEAKTEEHKKAERVYAAGSLRAWVPLLRDVIAQVLQLFEEQEKPRILFREISEEKWGLIGSRTKRLFAHKVWIDPDPDIDANLRVNNPEHVRNFFREKGLTAAWVLGLEE